MKKTNKQKLEEIQEVKAIENKAKEEMEIVNTETNPYEVIKAIIEVYKNDYELLHLGNKKKTKKNRKEPTVDNFVLRLEAKSDLFSKGNIPGITVE